jgi:hypothetical protein
MSSKAAEGKVADNAPLDFAAVQAAQRRRWRAATPTERMQALQSLYDFALACGALTRDRARREQAQLALWNRAGA